MKIIFDFILNKDDNDLLLECLNNDLVKLENLIINEQQNKNRKLYIDSFIATKKYSLDLYDPIFKTKLVDDVYHHKFEYDGNGILIDLENLLYAVHDNIIDLYMKILDNFSSINIKNYKEKIEIKKIKIKLLIKKIKYQIQD